MKTSISRRVARLALPLIVFASTQVRAIDIYFSAPDRRNAVVVHAGAKETILAYEVEDTGKTGRNEVKLLSVDTDANYPIPKLTWSADGRYLLVLYCSRSDETFHIYEFPEKGNVRLVDASKVVEASKDLHRRLAEAEKKLGRSGAGTIETSDYLFSWPPKEGRIKIVRTGNDDAGLYYSVEMDFDLNDGKVSNVIVSTDKEIEKLPPRTHLEPTPIQDSTHRGAE